MTDTNPLTEKLRPHVQAIQSAASSGDAKAAEIMTLYRMHCDAPNDPGAYAICHAVADEWIAANVQKVPLWT